MLSFVARALRLRVISFHPHLEFDLEGRDISATCGIKRALGINAYMGNTGIETIRIRCGDIVIVCAVNRKRHIIRQDDDGNEGVGQAACNGSIGE